MHIIKAQVANLRQLGLAKGSNWVLFCLDKKINLDYRWII